MLDQRNLAGIGNLYKAEVLFLSGVTPWTAVGDVASLDQVVSLGPTATVANRDRDEQITTGNRKRGEQTVGLRASRSAVPAVRHLDPPGRAGRSQRRNA